MKFSEAKIGMLVSVTGKHSFRFPNGARVIEKDITDSSIKIEDMNTRYKLWFFERGVHYPMGDIHPLVEDNLTKLRTFMRWPQRWWSTRLKEMARRIHMIVAFYKKQG